MWWPFSLPEPNDARLVAQASGHNASSSSHSSPGAAVKPQRYTTPASTEPSRLDSLWTSSRSRQQFGYFAVGAGLVLASSLVTRRALARKYAALRPAGLFSPSNKVPEAPGSLDAVEALGLATLNVCSFGVMMVGGGLWAFDISNLDELRAKVRKGMDIEGGQGKSDKEAEEDIEEWLAVTMARLQGKGDKDIAKMVEQVKKEGQSRKS